MHTYMHTCDIYTHTHTCICIFLTLQREREKGEKTEEILQNVGRSLDGRDTVVLVCFSALFFVLQVSDNKHVLQDLRVKHTQNSKWIAPDLPLKQSDFQRSTLG